MTSIRKRRPRAFPAWRGAGRGAGASRRAPPNINFVVCDGGQRFVVRIGDDIPVHQVVCDLGSARYRLRHMPPGFRPEAVHAEGGGRRVMRFVDMRHARPRGISADPKKRPRFLILLPRCHSEAPKNPRGPVLMFCAFHVLRDYAATLAEGRSRWLPEVPRLLATAERVERELGPIGSGVRPQRPPALEFPHRRRRAAVAD